MNETWVKMQVNQVIIGGSFVIIAPVVNIACFEKSIFLEMIPSIIVTIIVITITVYTMICCVFKKESCFFKTFFVMFFATYSFFHTYILPKKSNFVLRFFEKDCTLFGVQKKKIERDPLFRVKVERWL